MKFALITAAAAIAIAAASPAAAGEINHQARVGAGLRDGCSVQQVHTPAGKIVHSRPIVRCASRSLAAAPRHGGRDRDVRLAVASPLPVR